MHTGQWRWLFTRGITSGGDAWCLQLMDSLGCCKTPLFSSILRARFFADVLQSHGFDVSRYELCQMIAADELPGELDPCPFDVLKRLAGDFRGTWISSKVKANA